MHRLLTSPPQPTLRVRVLPAVNDTIEISSISARLTQDADAIAEALTVRTALPLLARRATSDASAPVCPHSSLRSHAHLRAHLHSYPPSCTNLAHTRTRFVMSRAPSTHALASACASLRVGDPVLCCENMCRDAAATRPSQRHTPVSEPVMCKTTTE
eukprot:3050264-Pleurochrysis_carterae.AAC.1